MASCKCLLKVENAIGKHPKRKVMRVLDRVRNNIQSYISQFDAIQSNRLPHPLVNKCVEFSNRAKGKHFKGKRDSSS